MLFIGLYLNLLVSCQMNNFCYIYILIEFIYFCFMYKNIYFFLFYVYYTFFFFIWLWLVPKGGCPSPRACETYPQPAPVLSGSSFRWGEFWDAIATALSIVVVHCHYSPSLTSSLVRIVGLSNIREKESNWFYFLWFLFCLVLTAISSLIEVNNIWVKCKVWNH